MNCSITGQYFLRATLFSDGAPLPSATACNPLPAIHCLQFHLCPLIPCCRLQIISSPSCSIRACPNSLKSVSLPLDKRSVDGRHSTNLAPPTSSSGAQKLRKTRTFRTWQCLDSIIAPISLHPTTNGVSTILTTKSQPLQNVPYTSHLLLSLDPTTAPTAPTRTIMRLGVTKSFKLQRALMRLARQGARCKEQPNQEPAAQVLVCPPTTLDRRFILMIRYAGSTLNGASPSGIQHNVSGPQTYPLGCSQTPKPADYAQPPQPYSRAPTSAPNCAPTSAPGPPISPPQPPTSPYRPVSPPGDTVSNEGGTVATTGPGLQRAVSLFRTPADARNDHGEQLPAFTDVALPEQMVPQDIAQRRLTSSQAPRTPPPPHTFSAPSGPPPSLHYRAQVGSTSPPPTVPRSPPPPHTFSSRPQSSLRNILPPPPLLNSSSPLSLSPATAPASPIHNDPPPAFTPSNSHYPAPEKTTPYARPQPGNTRVMSNSMAVYASANRTTTQPTMRFDLDAAFGRSASPGQPQENGLSFYR